LWIVAAADPRHAVDPDEAPGLEEYRFALFGRPGGPWRSTRRGAMADAAAAGEATWDSDRQVHFLHTGAEIVTRPRPAMAPIGATRSRD
jgi:hypothetical protein